MPNTESDQDFNPYPVNDVPADDAPSDAEPTPRNPDGTFAPRAEAPAAKGLSAALRREAKQVLRLNDDDLAGMTPAEIRAEIRHDKLLQRLDRQGAGEGRSAQAAAPEPSPDYSPLSAETADYETLVKAVNGLAARMRGLEDAAQQIPKMASYLNAHAEREQLSLIDELDEFFAEHPETYGVGTREDVDHDGPDGYFRKAMAAAALKVTRGRQKGLRAALERLHAERTGQRAAKAPPPARPADEPDDEADRLYASGAGKLGRVSQRGGPAPAPGYDAALAEVDSVFRRADARKGRSGNVIPGGLNGLPE